MLSLLLTQPHPRCVPQFLLSLGGGHGDVVLFSGGSVCLHPIGNRVGAVPISLHLLPHNSQCDHAWADGGGCVPTPGGHTPPLVPVWARSIPIFGIFQASRWRYAITRCRNGENAAGVCSLNGSWVQSMSTPSTAQSRQRTAGSRCPCSLEGSGPRAELNQVETSHPRPNLRLWFQAALA